MAIRMRRPGTRLRRAPRLTGAAPGGRLAARQTSDRTGWGGQRCSPVSGKHATWRPSGGADDGDAKCSRSRGQTRSAADSEPAAGASCRGTAGKGRLDDRTGDVGRPRRADRRFRHRSAGGAGPYPVYAHAGEVPSARQPLRRLHVLLLRLADHPEARGPSPTGAELFRHRESLRLEPPISTLAR